MRIDISHVYIYVYILILGSLSWSLVASFFFSSNLHFVGVSAVYFTEEPEFLVIVVKAEEATRDSRQTKQDRYAEMRRRKDEEHEARERMLVG